MIGPLPSVRALAVLLAALAVIPLGALTEGASAATPRASLPDIEDEVMCTICGTLLAESDSPQAQRERALIRTLIDRGQTKGQIENALVAQYGPNVLATPSTHGFDLAAWLVPGCLIAVALAGLALGASRLRRRSPDPSPPTPIDPADEARLERDLSSYDL